jgi:nitroreductase
VTSKIDATLEARYGEAAATLAPAWNETLTALLQHRSVRAYLPTPLPPGTLEALVAAAQSAATSSNLQTWSVVAVENPVTKKQLAEVARGQKHIEDCPLFLVWLADLSRLQELGRRKGVPTEGLSFLEVLLVGVIDAALAAQNAVTALESMGLGSVYIGAMRNDPVAVARLLGLPPNVMAVFGLCVGYPDPARPASVKPRLPQEVVLHRERYDPALPQAAVESYDETLTAFQRTQAMAARGWSGPALARIRGAESLSDRDRLAAALKELGFGLR